jgi:hypothetical protein
MTFGIKAASGVKADPASLSRWLIRNGLSFKKNVWPAPSARGFIEIAA